MVSLIGILWPSCGDESVGTPRAVACAPKSKQLTDKYAVEYIFSGILVRPNSDELLVQAST